MKIIKHHSHKQGLERLQAEKQNLLDELETAITSISAVDGLTKITYEKSKVRRWGGVLYSPRTLNALFRQRLYPNGWATYNPAKDRYEEPKIRFANVKGGNDRYRKMDGLKDRVGLEVQFGKYAFMGYDIFSKMIIFKNQEYIDYGIEIVLMQEMVDCMSTGVSAFEHIMIDFEHRGTADIDIPVLVLGISATEQEWDRVREIQQKFRVDPIQTKKDYPQIGSSDLKGEKPGPKS